MSVFKAMPKILMTTVICLLVLPSVYRTSADPTESIESQVTTTTESIDSTTITADASGMIRIVRPASTDDASDDTGLSWNVKSNADALGTSIVNTTNISLPRSSIARISIRSRLALDSSRASESADKDEDSVSLLNPHLRSPLSRHINQFGLDFLRLTHCVSSLGCNALHSPLSISILLSMLLHGSGSTTSHEIEHFFDYPHTFNSTLQLHNAFQDLLYELGKNQRQYLLRIGSLALFSDRMNVSRRFRTGVREHYHASVFNLNFRQSRQTLEVLNNWIRSITANRSQRLFRERVRPDTQLLLLNAVYFQGEWKVPFQSLKQKRTFHNQIAALKTNVTGSKGHVFQSMHSSVEDGDTSNKTFRLDSVAFEGNNVDIEGSRCAGESSKPELKSSEVSMMATTGTLPYAVLADGHIQSVRLPYMGGLGMYLFVPDNQKYTIRSMLDQLNATQLDDWIRSMKGTPVELLMPRFRMEQTYELRPLLARLGLNRLFTGQADLSRAFASPVHPDAQPQISSAVHRAMLEVNEHGTKASASTAFQSFTVSGFQGERMHVDRPFMFVIRDDVRAVNLFVGTLCSFL